PPATRSRFLHRGSRRPQPAGAHRADGIALTSPSQITSLFQWITIGMSVSPWIIVAIGHETGCTCRRSIETCFAVSYPHGGICETRSVPPLDQRDRFPNDAADLERRHRESLFPSVGLNYEEPI